MSGEEAGSWLEQEHWDPEPGPGEPGLRPESVSELFLEPGNLGPSEESWPLSPLDKELKQKNILMSAQRNPGSGGSNTLSHYQRRERG